MGIVVDTARRCVFCRIIAGEEPAQLVFSDDVAIAFLDRRPLFEGHVLLVPRAHHETLDDLPAGLVGPLFERARGLSVAVQSATGAQGSFVAMNNRVSQSVPHLHVHVVPRRAGDGLRGFFWPRTSYDNDDAAAAMAASVAAADRSPRAVPPRSPPRCPPAPSPRRN
ncbi:MAG: HIT family protein [Acidimicrobiales bacterium]